MPSRFRLAWIGIAGAGGVIVAVLLFAASLAAYTADFVAHPGNLLCWYDLNVYNDAGLIARELPGYLYQWQLNPAIRFTYPPFAAILFAGGSLIPFSALRWLMTLASVTSIPLSAWLVLGALGQRGRVRMAGTMVTGALALWSEPVWHALYFGQIEPLLMLLVVWDLTRPDRTRWQGAGVGIAAGVKLVPLIFIPYLLLAGKFRQAAVATGAFAATIAAGFVLLPGPSSYWWLTGYFVRPGKTGAINALVNQSLLGMFARQSSSTPVGQSAWLPVAVVTGVAGIVAGAVLSRSGRPVAGWTLVGLTSVLVSPISWDHHWVWIVPFLAMAIAMAIAARRAARWSLFALVLVLFGLFGAWPWVYNGAKAFIPERGLLGGWGPDLPGGWAVARNSAWSWLTWNLYVIIGCVLYLGMVIAAVLVWRSARRSRRLRRLAVQPAQPECEPGPEPVPVPVPAPAPASPAPPGRNSRIA